MYDLLVVEVGDARDELRKEAAGVVLLEILVGEDVVEELAAGGVLEDDADVAVRLDDLVEADNVGVAYVLEHLDLAFHLGHLCGVPVLVVVEVEGGVGSDLVALDEFDGDLLAPLLVDAKFDFSELALAEGLEEEVVSKVDLLSTRVSGKVGEAARGGDGDARVECVCGGGVDVCGDGGLVELWVVDMVGCALARRSV